MRDGLTDPLETVYVGVDERNRVKGIWSSGEAGVVAARAAQVGDVRLFALTYPLPAALAELVTERISGRGGAGGAIALPRIGALASQALRCLGLPAHRRPEELGVRGEGYPPAEMRSAVRAALLGRRLFASEVGWRAGLGRGLFPEDITRALTALRLEGRIGSEASVAQGRDGVWRCGRCGSSRIRLTPCPNCGDLACPACPDCQLLGNSRACRRLYFLPDRESRRGPAPVPHPVGKPEGNPGPILTTAQQRAAEGLLTWLLDPDATREALLWAVCGAGKTAVARPAIEAALSGGLRVLYASPRRQVIRQVAADLPRHGLVLATIHQALRYQEAFDLLVVDEPDAYPYRGNSLLAAGLRRSARPGARWLYLTATPEPELLARAESGSIHLTILSERFHGRPSPVPKIIVPPPWGVASPERQGIGALAAELIKARLSDSRRCFLVFTPTVALSRSLRLELAVRLGVAVESVDAGSPGRDQVIAAFRTGSLRVLVSTTVLERGVTFPFLDVLVAWANHPLLDRVSLLQMAGRTGRAADDTEGVVWFLAEDLGPEMEAARRLTETLDGTAG